MARIGSAGRRILGRERYEALARIARRGLAKGGVMHPNHHLLEVFSATGTCCINHARERLGFIPAFDLARGLAATEAHLKSLVRAN